MNNPHKPTGWFHAIDQNLERWALLIFYCVLVLTMAVEVVRREVFSNSSVWGEEIVRYSFIYLVWIGAAAAVRERAHIRIDVIFDMVSPRVKAWLYLFGDFVMLIVAGFALYWSWESLMVSMKFGSVSHGLRISMAWFLVAVPLGMALLLYRLLQSIKRDISDIYHGRPVYEGERLFD